MNNKGQVLVLFVLLLPILLLLAGIMIDTGFAYIEKRKIEHVIKDTISYALEHLDKNESDLKLEMTNLVKQNIDDIYEIRVEINNETVILQVEKRIETIFSAITVPSQTIKLAYKGNIVNNKKIIVKG